MTTATPERVVCGHRETRPDGSRYECVRPPDHPNHAHHWVRLNASGEST